LAGYKVDIVYKDANDTVIISPFHEQVEIPKEITFYLMGVVKQWVHHYKTETTRPEPLDYPIKQGPSIGDFVLIRDEENNRVWYRINSLDSWDFTPSFEDPDLVEAFNITIP